MQVDNRIKVFCAEYGISVSELARRLNKSPQAFIQKLNRGTLSLNDLNEIATVTGCQLECNLVLSSGQKVKIND
jgi:transcriptional regulator with XRE-family HTH domain